MGGAKPHLDLRAEHCDQCGACLDVCTEDALKVGRGFIYVDWPACGACVACAEACDRDAIGVKGGTSPVLRARREGAVTTISEAKKSTPARWARVLREPPDERSTVPDAGIPWSMREVSLVVVIAIALLVVEGLALRSDFARELTVQGLVALRAAAQTVYYLLLLGMLALLANRRGVPFKQAFGLVRPRLLSSAAWVVAALFVTRLVSTMYGTLVQSLGWEPPAGAVAELTDWFGADILGLALATVTVVLVGPFVEEVVFRGMLLSGLRRVVSTRLAVAGSALLFASSHLTLWTFVPLTVLGLAAGWLVVSKGSVWPAVVLHSLYNAVAVFAAFYIAGAVGV